MLTPRSLFPDFKPLSCLCLDAEFASSRDILEMLELSIADSEGKLIYNHRFKPARMRRWNLIPHGIKPAMVDHEPSFASCRPSIQRILDGADYLMGFALENDLRRLEAQGTRHLPDKKIIELRDWFWLIYGRDHGLDYTQDIGLSRCCTELGVEIDPEKAHGAAYDTTVTLRCFHVLLERFVDSHGSFDSFEALYDAFAAEVAVAKEAYDIEAAKGHCSIYANTSPTASSPYRFIAGKEAPDPDRTDLIATIPVANRRKAVMDLSKMLTGTVLSSPRFTFRRLSPAMIERFKAYTNSADIAEIDFARNVMKLSAAFQSVSRHR
ncbi:MAG: hypothetical protein HFJ93_02095 [Muribaculaceae bacterium]|jgi:hypothetical protein|nr:hypothetical protein [Muribaculaceae bacterium]